MGIAWNGESLASQHCAVALQYQYRTCICMCISLRFISLFRLSNFRALYAGHCEYDLIISINSSQCLAA